MPTQTNLPADDDAPEPLGRNRDFRVLLASVTYFKAKPGDQVSVNVPEDDSAAEWAAIEAAL